MNHWIKVGPCLYNLDQAKHIDLGALIPSGQGDEPGVRITWSAHDMEWATFTAAEADAVRRYITELVAQRKIADLTVVPAPVSTVDSPKEGT